VDKSRSAASSKKVVVLKKKGKNVSTNFGRTWEGKGNGTHPGKSLKEKEVGRERGKKDGGFVSKKRQNERNALKVGSGK